VTRLLAGRDWPVAAVWLVVLLALGGVVFRATLLYVIDAWNGWDSGQYYAHGYLVLLISLFLVLRQRRLLASIPPCPDPAALPLLAAGSLLWLAGNLAGVMLVQTVALLPLLAALLWAVLGLRLARHLFLPVFILAFAIPVWSMLPELLQQFTADSAYAMSRLLGVPVLLADQVMVLPAGRLAIEKECSGLSYLLAALTLGTLYGYLNRTGLLARVIVIAVAGVAALLANILRVLIVVYIAWRSDMQDPLIYNHFNLGWYLFGALVVLLLVLDYGLARRTPAATVRTAAPVLHDCSLRMPVRLLLPALAGLLLVAGPVLGRLAEQRLQELPLFSMQLPAGVAGWTGPQPLADDWSPVFHGAMRQTAVYRAGDDSVLVFAGFYPRQRQGSELIYDGNAIADGTVWFPGQSHARVTGAAGHAVLEQQLYTRDGRRRLVWYWYRVAGRDTTSRFLAKGYQLLGLVGNRPQAGVVALAADYSDTADTARARLAEFTQRMGKDLSRSLDGRVIQQETEIR